MCKKKWLQVNWNFLVRLKYFKGFNCVQNSELNLFLNMYRQNQFTNLCKKRICHYITSNGWYAIKPNQPKPSQKIFRTFWTLHSSAFSRFFSIVFGNIKEILNQTLYFINESKLFLFLCGEISSKNIWPTLRTKVIIVVSVYMTNKTILRNSPIGRMINF